MSDVTQTFLKTFAPTVSITRAETQKVQCPYCALGFAEVTAVHGDAGMQIPGFKEPHKCVSCERYFKFVPQVTVIGVAIQGE